ncbi:branched-chain amino acid ABC transporter permease [Salarchaeum japonicum]|uniref:Branched-chain amino acid ABC transporter permease n=1 Tax=Salarchaeum japonicum TaxID=555573 RepID=A0AAV3T2K6_9EURY|nr:branched-chain amino acid ABC transporter permease [Salarchaeum japonicum]
MSGETILGLPARRTALVTLAVLVVAPFVLPTFQTYVLSEVLVLALFATGFNLLYGYTGLLSFGHAMFFGGAGYALGIFLRDVAPMLPFGGATPLLAFVIAAVLGVVVATAIAVPVGYLSVRLEEIYFAMLTLSFSMALYTLVNQNYFGVTNGSDGILVLLQTANLFGFQLSLYDRVTYYFVILLVVAPSMYILWRVANSPFGLVSEAIRENSERASGLGIDVRRHQWAAFVLSAVFTGIAGVLVAPLHSSLSPGASLHWTISAEPVIMTVFGGPYSFIGPTVGALFYRYIRWGITQFPLLEAHWQLVFGTLILVIVVFAPRGVSGLLTWVVDRVRGNGGESA